MPDCYVTAAAMDPRRAVAPGCAVAALVGIAKREGVATARAIDQITGYVQPHQYLAHPRDVVAGVGAAEGYDHHVVHGDGRSESQVKWDRRTFQLVVPKRVFWPVTVYDGYRPATDQEVAGSNPAERALPSAPDELDPVWRSRLVRVWS